MTNYKDLSDRELLVLIKGNDQTAYTEIFDRHYMLLYTHAYNKLRDKYEAEDIVQEVFSILWFKRVRLDVNQNFTAFLFILTRNLVIDRFRNKKSIKHFEEEYNKIAEHTSSPTDYMTRENQLNSMIQKEISFLPPRMREVFELRLHEQLSNREISVKMGIKESTVSDQMKKALKFLRGKLKSVRILFDLLLFLLLIGFF